MYCRNARGYTAGFASHIEAAKVFMPRMGKTKEEDDGR